MNILSIGSYVRKEVLPGLLVLLVLCLVVVGVIMVPVLIDRHNNPLPTPLVTWNLYSGDYAGYRVEIDESQHQGQPMLRIVHLEPKGGLFTDQQPPTPPAITGHDYTGDGQFDRVFICSNDGGFNSVRFTGKSAARIWQPCMGDERTATPFTDDEVTSAEAMIYGAMAAIHNPAHRTMVYVPNHRT